MKAVHFTSVHPHTDVRIFLKECVSLANAGFDVTLIAPDIKDQVISGVKILGVPKPSGRFSRMFGTTWRVCRRARREKPDIYHFHDPELLPIGFILALTGARVVYDAHEDVPRQMLNKHWIPISLRRLVSWGFEQAENFIAKRLSGVVAATPYIAERFSRINQNTVNINNFPLSDELAPTSYGVVRGHQLCYVGSISRIRGIRPLVEALQFVPGFRLVLCGRFAEPDFESELRALPGWAQVDYRGQIDRYEVGKVMAASIAGLVTLFPIANYLDSLPIKMFEYMAAELPVIASNFPLWREIIESENCGLCVDPTDPQAIAEAIHRLIDNPELAMRLGKAGREAVLTRYNWTIETEKLLQFYNGILST